MEQAPHCRLRFLIPELSVQNFIWNTRSVKNAFSKPALMSAVPKKVGSNMWGSQLGWLDLSVTTQTVAIAFVEMADHLSSELECQ